MALNTESEGSNGSERQTKQNMALNARMNDVMALNLETENATRIALNTDTDEWWLWTPNEDAMMALNAETGNVTLNVKLGSDDGSEHRNQKMR